MNFDKIVNRKGTGCLKYDALKERYGDENLTPAWVADMDFPVMPEITNALIERLEHPIYGYAVVPEEFWNSIIDWTQRRYGWTIKREELDYIPGVVKGIGFIVNYFTSPGDKVLIQQPVYHPFRLVPTDNARIIVNNPLIVTESGNYAMDLKGLREVVEKEHPKLMILCNPHNPIGIQWDEATLREVAEICHDNGVIVISDEIHADLMLWGIKHIPFASVSDKARDITITLGAPSKTFNIAGLVSSWVVIQNKSLREGFFAWLKGNEFDDPTFIATIATIVAYTKGDKWVDEVTKYIESNQLFLEDYLKENIPQLKVVRPQASFLTWLDCRNLSLTDSELRNFFINKAKLALNDGVMFGPEGSGYMRLNIGCPHETLKAILENLKAAVENL